MIRFLSIQEAFTYLLSRLFVRDFIRRNGEMKMKRVCVWNLVTNIRDVSRCISPKKLCQRATLEMLSNRHRCKRHGEKIRICEKSSRWANRVFGYKSRQSERPLSILRARAAFAGRISFAFYISQSRSKKRRINCRWDKLKKNKI